MLRKLTVFLGVAALIVGIAGVTPLQAAPIVLSDLNSTVRINTGADAGVKGAYDWVVNGVDQLAQQWFWIRTTGDTRERRLDELTLSQTTVGTDSAIIKYTDQANRYTVEVIYTLTGGAVGVDQSLLTEQIRIKNTSGGSLSFSFFQYTDMNLNDTAGDDVASFNGSNAITQTDPAQGILFAETVVGFGNNPTRWEINTSPTTLNSLEDNAITNLSNSTSPTAGDVTWAFQWDFSLANNASFQINKTKELLPVSEPATLLLLGSGLFGLGWWGRRRQPGPAPTDDVVP